MKTAIIPTLPEFGREAIIVMGGAILAALILSQFPQIRNFIAKNTGQAGCDCDKPLN